MFINRLRFRKVSIVLDEVVTILKLEILTKLFNYYFVTSFKPKLLNIVFNKYIKTMKLMYFSYQIEFINFKLI